MHGEIARITKPIIKYLNFNFRNACVRLLITCTKLLRALGVAKIQVTCSAEPNSFGLNSVFVLSILLNMLKLLI